MSYFERLRVLAHERHTLLCVGLDPDPERIEGGAAGALRHCQEVVRQTEEHVCCYKPNSAFWEQYGPDGWGALLELRDAAPDTPFLLDAKRGDMDNTMRAYARAVFNTLAMDAATVNPYLGHDSVEPFLLACRRYGSGVFFVVHTSNAGAAEIQEATLSDGTPLWRHIAGLVHEWGKDLVGERGLSRRIAGNATLLYELELVSIRDQNTATSPAAFTTDFVQPSRARLNDR